MTDVAKVQYDVPGARLSARAASVIPPIAALFYPWAVWGFYNSVLVMREATGQAKVAPLLAATVSLALAFVPSLVSYFMLLRPVERDDRFAARRWISYLAFATPTLFTMERVIFAGLRSTLDDRFAWVSIWAALTIVAAIGMQRSAERQPAWTLRLRFAHGISAAAILVTFLGVHLWNHFIGLLGPQVHVAAMDMLRAWYRFAPVEIILVGLFVFQVISGASLATIRVTAPGDYFRTLQVATGVGLAAFLVAHLLVIFVVARWQNGVDTNWIFATGFKIGLLGNLSNARQIPYYLFVVSATVAHLACGLRVVLNAHGWPLAMTNRMTVLISMAGAMLAIAIVAAMVGLQIG